MAARSRRLQVADWRPLFCPKTPGFLVKKVVASRGFWPRPKSGFLASMWCLFLKRHHIAGFLAFGPEGAKKRGWGLGSLRTDPKRRQRRVFGQKHLKGVRGLGSLTPLLEHPKEPVRPKTPTDPRMRVLPQTRKDFWPLKGAKSRPTPEPPANSRCRRHLEHDPKKRPLHRPFLDHFCAKRKNPAPKAPKPERSRLFGRRPKRPRSGTALKPSPLGVFGQNPEKGPKRPLFGPFFGPKKGAAVTWSQKSGFLDPDFWPKEPKLSTALASTSLGPKGPKLGFLVKTPKTVSVFWREAPKERSSRRRRDKAQKVLAVAMCEAPDAPSEARRSFGTKCRKTAGVRRLLALKGQKARSARSARSSAKSACRSLVRSTTHSSAKRCCFAP